MTGIIESFLENNNNSKLREQTVEYKFLFELLEYSASIGKSVENIKEMRKIIGIYTECSLKGRLEMWIKKSGKDKQLFLNYLPHIGRQDLNVSV